MSCPSLFSRLGRFENSRNRHVCSRKENNCVVCHKNPSQRSALLTDSKVWLGKIKNSAIIHPWFLRLQKVLCSRSMPCSSAPTRDAKMYIHIYGRTRNKSTARIWHEMIGKIASLYRISSVLEERIEGIEEHVTLFLISRG
jgi:hypothetical protein